MRNIKENHWQFSLEYPNCRNENTVIAHEEVVDEYDRIRDRGVALMVRSLYDLVEVQNEDEVRKLQDALHSGLLLPQVF